MTLVAGLGNVGREYELTRHNVGFMLVDLILQDLAHSEISKSSFKGQLFKSELSLFLKPSTFMNASGQSILAVREFYKCERLIVIHDDIDLNLGVLRFKQGGGNGGHNGLKSVDALCGREYERVRVGIGKKEPVLNFVLGKFSPAELETLRPVLEQAKKGVLAMLQGENISKIASTYNLTLKKDENLGAGADLKGVLSGGVNLKGSSSANLKANPNDSANLKSKNQSKFYPNPNSETNPL